MIDVTTNGLDAILVEFGEFDARTTRALVRSLNRSITTGRATMVPLMADETGIKAGEIRAAMPLYEATQNRLEASFAATLKRIPLVEFHARGPYPSRGRGTGVTYRLAGSKGRLEHGFLAIMASGHKGVFLRSTTRFQRYQKPTWKKKRPAIYETFGPSLGQVFRKHRPAGIASALEAFDKNFDHEMGFAASEDARA